jgi:hypothetical protein
MINLFASSHIDSIKLINSDRELFKAINILFSLKLQPQTLSARIESEKTNINSIELN